MGKLNLLDGQNNLMAGQMPTQLTCYLSPCPLIGPIMVHCEICAKKSIGEASTRQRVKFIELHTPGRGTL